ncbi:MAG: hypothetical protein IPK50_07500 [Fibrobacterota bacterium]|nr:hypothetical protein [Fibrobacterota bacterium]QQS06737.1 MAG: hypothetical protein IPK50_07500 [Fibrobacterota bacterium]
MRKSFFLLASVAVASSAGVPNLFRPNEPAKADQVNANFSHLDSAVGTKTDTAALTARLSGYATANSLVNFASVGALVGGLGGKADTAALSAVKASIPVGVNIGGKVDTAALTSRLSGYATSAAVANGLGGKADTVALTVRLAGYAPTSALANYATTSSLAAYATSAALASGLGGKADTAALSAVKASIPAGVNIGGKVDTAALTTRLTSYAKSTDLTGFAKSTDLAGYATTTSLASYAPLTSLASYAKTSDLTSYAKSTDLAGYATTTSLATYAPLTTLNTYAKTTALASYATTASLANYATTAAVNGKMATADYVESGHLKALGGLTGGRGYDGVFNGSKITLDTTELSMEAGDKFASLGHKHLIWSSGYNQWRISAEPGNTFSLVSGNRMFEMAVLNITSGGAAQFTGDVKIDGALTVQGVNVPDYVFESDYRLAPLTEVEAYTQVNKHLPEVPSAKEIEAGGMNLAKMNLVLLKKVEELTLHAIAQEKRIQALEANQTR